MATQKRVIVAFFQTEAGAEPVRDWLKSLDKEDRAQIGDDLQTLEFGWPIGMPMCRPLGQGLHELRTNLKDRIARVMFGIVEGKLIALHGFIKKSQATPASDMELARKRLKIVKGSK
jgi:phage-related protein